MDIYSDIALPALRNNGSRWIEETRGDSVDYRQDQFQEEWESLNRELEQTQREMFFPEGNGVRDDKGRFYSYATITFFLTQTGNDVADFNSKQWQKFTKVILGQPFAPSEPWLDDAIGIWSTNNFRLVKSLSDEYIKKLNNTVLEGVSAGRPWDDIMKDVRKMDKNMTRSRARLLARDQVGKLNGQLTKRRNQEAGVSLYDWLTAGDERVRPVDPRLQASTSVPNHRLMSGTTNKWDDATVMSEDGGKTWKKRPSNMQGAIPGSQIQCRCTAASKFDEMIEEVDQELEQEEAA
jgi:SPP1 gp7 family putative phage head morphogenesis protein